MIYHNQGYGFQPHNVQNNVGPFVTFGESATAYAYFLEMPGAKSEEVEIILQGQYLIVSGNLSLPLGKEIEYIQSERIYGSFQRIFTIPSNIDVDNVQAKLENGILEILLPKKDGHNASFRKVTIGKTATRHTSTSKN